MRERLLRVLVAFGVWPLCAIMLVALPGCIVLPIPNRSVHAYAVESRVVDAQTLAPIPHARIRDADDPSRAVEADSTGHFRLGCDYRWHAGYLLGTISYPIWPFTEDVTPPTRAFTVSAPGYGEQSFVAVLEGAGAPGETHTRPAAPIGRAPSNRDLRATATEPWALSVPAVPLQRVH